MAQSAAKVYVGALQGVTPAPVYSENLTIPAGVTVEGRWSVTSGFAWSRSGPRTQVKDTAAKGIDFAAGAGRSSGISGLAVEAAGTAPLSVGITISGASPTLSDFAVTGAPGSGSNPTTAIGVRIVGTASSAPNPLLVGTNGTRSGAFGGPATGLSVGIDGTFANPELSYVNAGGGFAGSSGYSIGVLLTNSPGSQLSNGTLTGGLGRFCSGLSATGGVSGIVGNALILRGCENAPGGPAISAFSAGAVFDKCASVVAIKPLVSNSDINGGTVAVSGGVTAGAVASDGCPLRIENNTISGGNAGATNSAGVICTSNDVYGTAGRNSACEVVGNRIQGGVASDRSAGLSCAGNCAGSNAACPGSCALVRGNPQILAGPAVFMVHANIADSNPPVEKNQIGLGANGVTACPGSGSTVIALSMSGSASSVVNNYVVTGSCQTAIALSLTAAARSGDGSVPSASFHSNTFIAGAPSSSGTPPTSTFAVMLTKDGALSAGQKQGTFRNNIFQADAYAGARFAFYEPDVGVDPVALTNNLFHTPFETGGPPLYRDENATTLTSAGQINALTDTAVANTIDGAPLFQLTFPPYRLSSASPARGAGTTTSAPPDDYDGHTRPSPTGTAPDIGADEVN